MIDESKKCAFFFRHVLCLLHERDAHRQITRALVAHTPVCVFVVEFFPIFDKVDVCQRFPQVDYTIRRLQIIVFYLIKNFHVQLPPYCANATGLHYCLEDPHYPEYDIKLAISQDYLFEKKYADVADQSANDLVQHLDKYVEEAFDYNYYTGASKGISPYDLTHWAGPEGYLCPSEVLYAMPKRARNVNGDWRVIVNNAHYYTQTTRLETCLTPDSACRLLAPCYQVYSIQYYSLYIYLEILCQG